MIPLIGNSLLRGSWPTAESSYLLKVEERASDDVLAMACFHGSDREFGVRGTYSDAPSCDDTRPTLILPAALSYLGPGDFISIRPRNGQARVLFRRNSHNNNFLITERCDNYCLMCSQPPKNVNDDALVDEILAIVPRLPKDLPELGFTGGEPTIVGDRFIKILHLCREHLPNTVLHVLSNGRRFADPTFTAKWAAVDHPDLMVGIPVYSDQSHIHDFVVQADGAFDETLRGILHLKNLGQKVEVRIVMHRHTIERLDRFAEFVASNLRFVDHVALMGLELMGFAIANQDDLWIKTANHAEMIARAAEILDQAGLRTSIYNTPLCLLHPCSRRFAVRSISDWKREYWDACKGCVLKADCGGAFFSSRGRLEPEIRPVL